MKNGGKNWSIVYPDYAFGQDMNKQFTNAVQKTGGRCSQSIPTPFPNDNFATFITKAASSNPDVVGIMAAAATSSTSSSSTTRPGWDKGTLASA